jgi:hypothetical protein
MPVLRLLALVAVVGLVGFAGAACATTVTGRGSLAAGVPTPGTSGSVTPSPSATSSEASTDSPTPTPSPTIDPIKTKERVTCVLVQSTIKSTNDRFNASKTREAQISVLKSAASSLAKTLKGSGLPRTDKILGLGNRIVTELNKVVKLAAQGGNPSTGPYNTLTTQFRTACLDL